MALYFFDKNNSIGRVERNGVAIARYHLNSFFVNFLSKIYYASATYSASLAAKPICLKRITKQKLMLKTRLKTCAHIERFKAIIGALFTRMVFWNICNRQLSFLHMSGRAANCWQSKVTCERKETRVSNFALADMFSFFGGHFLSVALSGCCTNILILRW